MLLKFLLPNGWWWIRFDDVRWNNFGRKEAEFAVALLDKWFGKRFLSIRRLLFVLSYFIAVIIIGHLTEFIAGTASWRYLTTKTDPTWPMSGALYPVGPFIIGGVGLAASLSITRFISVLVTKFAGVGELEI